LARFVEDLEVQRNIDIGLPLVSGADQLVEGLEQAGLLVDERLVPAADSAQAASRFDACLDWASVCHVTLLADRDVAPSLHR
jgi:hypothetical protein